MTQTVLTRSQVWSKSWPLVFANGLIPFVGVVDTAVIGLSGNATDLAGVALGAAVFSIFYWGTYSLRQSTTGLVAQALGVGNIRESQLVLLRSALLGLGIGAIVVLLNQPLREMAFSVLQGSGGAETVGKSYVRWRFFGTPAAIALFAITGWLIGAGLPRLVMVIYIFLAVTNAILDVWFVLGLGWGPDGVAIGTSIAEWLALILGLGLLIRHISKNYHFSRALLHPSLIFHWASFWNLIAVNRDLFIRSLCMIVGFTWFINSAARQGDAILAGNQILLQFITVWAFVLDAFAYTAEAETGRAVGRKSVADLNRAVRLTSEFAVGCALICSAITLLAGPVVLQAMIKDKEALHAALTFLPWCAAVPILGVASWQLDGIFVGATRSAAMRNSALASVFIYLAFDFWWAPAYGNTGVWAAFLTYYIARSSTLVLAWPNLKRAIAAGEATTPSQPNH
ncbi:MAG: MATE family efflux transporter [Robiginitomaculum sp.]|nr:MAG: MATE family efflux transporter [Robiginitomaculum sp.]